MATSSLHRASSFRDPGGRVVVADGRVLRRIAASGRRDFEAFLTSPTVRRFVNAGRMVSTLILDRPYASELAYRYGLADGQPLPLDDLLVEHDPIPFPSFPYEWPATMLEAAGRLTLELAEGLLKEGLGLKDGTPYNVLFRGPEPVFVDVLSVERRDPLDPIWLAYAQFVRTFLLPLAASRFFGIPLDSVLLARRDGLEPEEMYRLCGLLDRLRPPILSLVTLPAWLGSHKSEEGLYRPHQVPSAEQADFVLGRLLAGIDRQLRRVAPPENAQSRWAGYQEKLESYSQEQFSQKSRFMDRVLRQFQPRWVLDAGSNEGYFSLRAARSGASVVAIDSDAVVVDRLWRRARSERLDVLPLVVNLARPTPAVGWCNEECPAFLDRARGHFDAVFLLSLLHHLLVTDRIPLGQVIDLVAELTTDLAVIEYVGPDDPMFRRLVRGREALYEHLTRAAFEASALARFDLIRSEQISNSNRWLYVFRKRDGAVREFQSSAQRCRS